jgi:hypothetical protein
MSLGPLFTVEQFALNPLNLRQRSELVALINNAN